eukprot:TRINITY_DN15811_c0_g1_i1.p1 TRINITY_DN15811_c0_g1~~TRINITY_DN15811_c0_g1_i1.p1  ORF type:complete len:155 (-),score=23.95 TRINITY_DN15811_c0_g1_i1:109-528(-)
MAKRMLLTIEPAQVGADGELTDYCLAMWLDGSRFWYPVVASCIAKLVDIAPAVFAQNLNNLSQELGLRPADLFGCVHVMDNHAYNYLSASWAHDGLKFGLVEATVECNEEGFVVDLTESAVLDGISHYDQLSQPTAAAQ